MQTHIWVENINVGIVALFLVDLLHFIPVTIFYFLSYVVALVEKPEQIHAYRIAVVVLYDRVSDVVENGVSFASKILTHNRMH